MVNTNEVDAIVREAAGRLYTAIYLLDASEEPAEQLETGGYEQTVIREIVKDVADSLLALSNREAQ